MKCPKCKTIYKNPIAVAGGKKGGKAKVKKGFASSKVMEKAMRTRRENRLARLRAREEDRGRLEIIEGWS